MTGDRQYDAARIERILAGGEILRSVGKAEELADSAADGIRGVVEPENWAGQIADAILEVVQALEIEERGCALRGWCYGLLYGALDLGEPPAPAFAGSLRGPQQDELDRVAWAEGVARAATDLADGIDGVAARNKLLLQVAIDGGDAATTLRRIWQAVCRVTGDWQLSSAYDRLSWPADLNWGNHGDSKVH
jgi:hypothetical protein